MNRQQLITSIIILLILSIVSFFTFKKDSSKWKRGNAEEKPKLIDNFDVNSVAKVTMTTGNDKLELIREPSGWKIKSYYGYPVDFDKLSDFLIALKDMEVAQYPRLVKSQFASLKLLAPSEGKKQENTGLLLTLSDNSDKKILSMIIGDQHMPEKDESNPYNMVSPDGRYVLIPGTDKPALVTKSLNRANVTPTYWLDRKFVNLHNILSLALKDKDGKTKWRLFRTTLKSPWNIEGLKKNEIPLPRPMLDATSAMERITFNDISPASETELKDPQILEVKTAAGLLYKISFQKDKNTILAKFAITALPIPEEKPEKKETAEEKEKREKEYKKRVTERDKQLKEALFFTEWVYDIPTYKLDSVLKERSDFCKEKLPDDI